MHNIYVSDLIDKCRGHLLIGDKDTLLENFSKDTRTIQKGDIYIGIKGENFDGNSLYKDAFNKGARGCILSSETKIDSEYLDTLEDKFIVLVDDVIKSLQSLASYKRSLYDIPVIGITGSVGKTSTKDIVASVLSKKFHVLKTMGNLNNHIGVPLTILSLKDENCLVIEMGMNNLREISNLSKIARPTISIITNVGTAHIGLLGSRENILKAKLEILDGMEEKVLIINNDNDLLHKFYEDNKDMKIITYGINNESDYMATNIKLEDSSSTFKVNLNNLEDTFKINVPGEHFVTNSLCAITIGDYFNISNEDIKLGIENFILTKRRMQIEKFNNITIINDCYNANLDSMESAITYLSSLSKTRKIAILGSMLELGSFSESIHRTLGKFIASKDIDILICVGEDAKYIYEEAILNGFNKELTYAYNKNSDAIEKIKELIKENDTILIKSSLGMNFIEIYEGIIKLLK